MKAPLLSLSLIAAVITHSLQQPQGPAITTTNGNLNIASQGNITFQAGQGGEVQFMGPDGESMVVGEPGEKGEKGDPGDAGRIGPSGPTGPQGVAGTPGTNGVQGEKGMKGDMGPKGEMGTVGLTGEKGQQGPQGQQGLRGVSASDSALVSWNECAWYALNNGADYGHLATCTYNKVRNDTWLRITWGGNLRIAGCTSCCMRWYFTINGDECMEPGPIDALIYQTQFIHVIRHTTITGSCRSTRDYAGNSVEVLAGPIRVQFLVMECPRFGNAYDAYTGYDSTSRIIIEEIIPRDPTYPEISVVTPKEFVYMPSYCQFVFPHLGADRERNVGTLATRKFVKDHPHTVLRVTWEGNFRKRRCTNCCTRWWLEVDGSQCDSDEPIETSITSNSAQDIFAPTTLSGYCSSSGELPISAGNHTIRLVVGNCPGFRIVDAGNGFFSTSRLIVEEIPRPRDPEVNPGVYHPQWQHCTVSAGDIQNNNQNIGPFQDISCTLNKTEEDSSVRVTINTNLRLAGCEECCARWYVTFGGQECTDPAPVEAVIGVSGNPFSLHRGSTITGICSGTADGPIGAGNVPAILNVGPCNSNNATYDAYTGLETTTAITLEEYPAPLNTLPAEGYYPIWTQCVPNGPISHVTPADNSTDGEDIQTCTFTKQSEDTVLRVAWDGNIALDACNDCCMRWYITLDGEECTDPGTIDAALSQNIRGTPYILRRPASIVGICRSAGTDMMFEQGQHSVQLRVGPCETIIDGVDAPPRSGATTGFDSVSRFVVEEIPDSRSDCAE